MTYDQLQRLKALKDDILDKETRELINVLIGEVEVSEDIKILRGTQLADVFKLRKDSEYKDRYQTTVGSKTVLGVYELAKRIIEEGL